MKTEDGVLERVKEEPVFVESLQEELGLESEEVISVLAFLQKHKLIEMEARGEGVKRAMVAITRSGLQLLNLPDLPEEELPSDQLEVLEKLWGEEMGEMKEKGDEG